MRVSTPLVHLSNLNAPVPMLSFLRSPFAPRMCLGAILFQGLAKAVSKDALGWDSLMLTVVGSTAVIEVTLANRLRRGLTLPSGGFRIQSIVVTTSSAVNGWPSCHCTPGRSLNTTSVGDTCSWLAARSGLSVLS